MPLFKYKYYELVQLRIKVINVIYIYFSFERVLSKFSTIKKEIYVSWGFGIFHYRTTYFFYVKTSK